MESNAWYHLLCSGSVAEKARALGAEMNWKKIPLRTTLSRPALMDNRERGGGQETVRQKAER